MKIWISWKNIEKRIWKGRLKKYFFEIYFWNFIKNFLFFNGQISKMCALIFVCSLTWKKFSTRPFFTQFPYISDFLPPKCPNGCHLSSSSCPPCPIGAGADPIFWAADALNKWPSMCVQKGASKSHQQHNPPPIHKMRGGLWTGKDFCPPCHCQGTAQ